MNLSDLGSKGAILIAVLQFLESPAGAQVLKDVETLGVDLLSASAQNPQVGADLQALLPLLGQALPKAAAAA